MFLINMAICDIVDEISEDLLFFFNDERYIYWNMTLLEKLATTNINKSRTKSARII